MKSSSPDRPWLRHSSARDVMPCRPIQHSTSPGSPSPAAVTATCASSDALSLFRGDVVAFAAALKPADQQAGERHEQRAPGPLPMVRDEVAYVDADRDLLRLRPDVPRHI